MINANFTDDISTAYTANLYQWDTYQTLVITGIDFASVTPKVHFCNKRSKEALVVEGMLQGDGSVKVSIPNSLLSEKYDIIGYIYKNTGLTGQTIKSVVIPIIARLRPTEYSQVSDEDIAEIETIELEAKAIISNLTANEYDSTETYKRPNIVYYNYNAYMCKSSVGISGIDPSDTSNWQLICKGSHLTEITKDNSGNLVFNYKDGSSYTVQIATVDANVVDSDTVPALLLTSDDVTKVKNYNVEVSTNSLTEGLYLVVAKASDGTNSYMSEVINIESIYDIVIGYNFKYTVFKGFTCNESNYSIYKVRQLIKY